MFIGHHAAAFAGKRASSRIGLGTLVAAALWLDLVWPFFTLAGLEHFRIDPGNTAFTPLDFYDYPWTHSMLMSFGWSIAFAVVYRLTKKPWRDAAICLVLYLRTTTARDRIGTIALWALVVFLGLAYITNVTSPPPPNWQAVAWTAIAQWLFVPWAWWIDRHRQAST